MHLSQRAADSRQDERASALMLMPAGVLVVLLLGAIAFDLSLVFLRQRQATSTAVDLANDVVTLALDEEELRRTGVYRLDPELAAEVGQRLADQSDVGPALVRIEVTVMGPQAVQVVVEVAVDYVFARSIPGAAPGTTVRGSATATAAEGAP